MIFTLLESVITENGKEFKPGFRFSGDKETIQLDHVDEAGYPWLRIPSVVHGTICVPARAIDFDKAESTDELLDISEFIDKSLGKKMLMFDNDCFSNNREVLFLRKGENIGDIISNTEERIKRNIFYSLIWKAAKEHHANLIYFCKNPYSGNIKRFHYSYDLLMLIKDNEFPDIWHALDAEGRYEG